MIRNALSNHSMAHICNCIKAKTMRCLLRIIYLCSLAREKYTIWFLFLLCFTSHNIRKKHITSTIMMQLLSFLKCNGMIWLQIDSEYGSIVHIDKENIQGQRYVQGFNQHNALELVLLLFQLSSKNEQFASIQLQPNLL